VGWFGIVHQVAIAVVLHDEAGWIEPVVEDLTSEHVSTHAPAVLVALLPQPVVTQHLGIEVVRLVRGMVHMVLGALVEEETVVIDHIFTAVQPPEYGNVHALIVVDDLCFTVSRERERERERERGWNTEAATPYITRYEVEVRPIKLHGLVEVGGAPTKVA
jgi:hypothetical protein